MTQKLNDNPHDRDHRQIAENGLRRDNVLFPAQPIIPIHLRDQDGDFRMPANIAELPSHSLGALLSDIGNLLQWYGAVMATAKADRLAADRVKNFTEAKMRMVIMSDRDMMKDYKAREDKEAFVNTSEEVIEAQKRFDASESKVLMVEQIYKDMERNFNVVSREITRRGAEWNRGEREGNIR